MHRHRSCQSSAYRRTIVQLIWEQAFYWDRLIVSTEDDSDNPFPMRCHSSANPFSIIDQCANPRSICQSNVNPGLIRQSIANADAMCGTHQAPDPLQLPQYSANLPIQCQSSVNHTQSEDNCPSNLGTSVLYEPTEVSRRRTIQTIHFRRDATPAPIIFCHSANIDQSANPMSIRG